MKFLDYLKSEECWLEFLKSKEESDFAIDKEITLIKKIIKNKRYLEYYDEIMDCSFFNEYPKKLELPKPGTNKKRIVYSYKKEKQMILKYINSFLTKYDYFFSENLYSFRKHISVKSAIKDLTRFKNEKNYYTYKVDIQSYFNSIDKNLLLDDLKRNIDDVDLLSFFEHILNTDKVISHKKIIEENMGAMAGIPISSFFANFYLREVDRYFKENNVKYYRYADDIVIMAKSLDELLEYKNTLIGFLTDKHLLVNEKKEELYKINEAFDFLGFRIDGHKIDIAYSTLVKIKHKIRLESRKIRRWMYVKKVNPHSTLKVLNRKFNRKFFGKENGELSWMYWYFPIINTIESLKIIDSYYQQEARFMITGVHNKRNFKKVTYEILQKSNYKPLVSMYYKFINRELEAKEETKC